MMRSNISRIEAAKHRPTLETWKDREGAQDIGGRAGLRVATTGACMRICVALVMRRGSPSCDRVRIHVLAQYCRAGVISELNSN